MKIEENLRFFTMHGTAMVSTVTRWSRYIRLLRRATQATMAQAQYLIRTEHFHKLRGHLPHSRFQFGWNYAADKNAVTISNCAHINFALTAIHSFRVLFSFRFVRFFFVRFCSLQMLAINADQILGRTTASCNVEYKIHLSNLIKTNGK